MQWISTAHPVDFHLPNAYASSIPIRKRCNVPHYHYMNGSAGCMPDSSDVYARRRDAIGWAEQLFGDCICDRCFREMSRTLRARDGANGAIYYFDRDCERETGWNGACYAGADYVEITRERGGIREGDYDETICACEA